MTVTSAAPDPSQDFGPRERVAAMRVIATALEEDGARADRTSELCVPSGARGRAVLRARQAGVIAGLHCVALTLEALALSAGEYRVELHTQDGATVRPLDALALIEGPTRVILAGERTFLNLVGLLAGVATLTRQFTVAAGPRCCVLDTRKTWPGGRILQKYAVRCGGGRNHRMGLSDGILIKDNHRAAGMSVPDAVRAARARFAELPLVVEVDDLAALQQTLALPVDRILLDNFTPEQLARAVALRDAAPRRVPLEASGGVTLQNVARIAAAGVDMVSVGALTHSAPALDVGLDWESVVAR
jgi:nicotinate-nucleotide pyrophosphorylase (carboxylating)